MNPGDVIWIEFPGAVQTKRRPAVVLSSATYHASRPDVIVGQITSQVARASAASDHILQDWSAAGLRVPSAFPAFIVTLPKSAIVSTIGMLSKSDRDAVVNCVKKAIELN